MDKARLSTYFGQQLLNHANRLAMITTTKQIGVVDDVVDVVEAATLRITVVQWPGFVVSSVELPADAAEQGGHGEVGFAVTVVAGGVVDDRGAVGQGAVVSAP